MAEAIVKGYDPLATSGGWRRARSRWIVHGILAAFAAWYLLPLVVVILNS